MNWRAGKTDYTKTLENIPFRSSFLETKLSANQKSCSQVAQIQFLERIVFSHRGIPALMPPALQVQRETLFGSGTFPNVY